MRAYVKGRRGNDVKVIKYMKINNPKWMMYTKKADFNALAEKFHISPVTARILRNKDICDEAEIERFLRADMKDMYDPFLMKDLKKAVDILEEKIKAGKKIRIIGDYDVDGVSASVILYKGLKSLGAEVDTDVPDRVKDGYGINNRLIDLALDEGIDTIITCDNGIAAKEAVQYAKDKGLTVIVTDHHEPPDELPEADAVIDPKQKICKYPYSQLCGAGVAYKLMVAMGVSEEVQRELLKFAAIATVCDVVELRDENRIIAKNGLKAINEDEAKIGGDEGPGFNKGLHALFLSNGLSGKEIGVYHIGFVIGPCINAGGRLGSAKEAIDLFLEEDPAKCTKQAKDLTDQNVRRKSMTEDMVRKACNEIEKKYEDDVIVVYIPECHEAIAGIVAGRIKERFYRPTFVMTDAEGGLIKASGRSIEGYNMFEELKKCDDLLEKYGGHEMAAGLSIKKENIDTFSKRLNDNLNQFESRRNQIAPLHIHVRL